MALNPHVIAQGNLSTSWLEILTSEEGASVEAFDYADLWVGASATQADVQMQVRRSGQGSFDGAGTNYDWVRTYFGFNGGVVAARNVDRFQITENYYPCNARIWNIGLAAPLFYHSEQRHLNFNALSGIHKHITPVDGIRLRIESGSPVPFKLIGMPKNNFALAGTPRDFSIGANQVNDVTFSDINMDGSGRALEDFSELRLVHLNYGNSANEAQHLQCGIKGGALVQANYYYHTWTGAIDAGIAQQASMRLIRNVAASWKHGWCIAHSFGHPETTAFDSINIMDTQSRWDMGMQVDDQSIYDRIRYYLGGTAVPNAGHLILTGRLKGGA